MDGSADAFSSGFSGNVTSHGPRLRLGSCAPLELDDGAVPPGALDSDPYGELPQIRGTYDKLKKTTTRGLVNNLFGGQLGGSPNQPTAEIISRPHESQEFQRAACALPT